MFRLKSPSDLHFLLNFIDLICKLAQIQLRKLLILQLLYECICVLSINLHLQAFDVSFVVLNPLSQSLNIVSESLGFYVPSTVDLFSTLANFLDVCL